MPVLVRAAALTAIYLLVLTSIDPGDIVIGAVVALAVSTALRPRARHDASVRWREYLSAVVALTVTTTAQIVCGSWRTVRFCVGSAGSPGFVEIPRSGRSDAGVALWGVLTGEAPDEVPIDVDDERDILIVHLVDVRNPDDVRERHRVALEQRQRKVVP